MTADHSHNIERLLHAIGLEPRRSAASYVLPALGIFAVGALVGGALGLLFAPKSGRELRGDLGKKLERTRERAPDNGA
jgi:YtxH-like protein